MRGLLSVIVSFISAMTFAQQQPAELTPQDSRTMLQIGKSYLGTQYVANTLDRDGEEELVIRTDAVDCLTFVEYTLAQALGSSFTENLQKIRYRDGIIDGYPSRLHYTSDWIENGIRQGFLTDVTAENSVQTLQLSLSYMSAHPKLYKKLANSPENATRESIIRENRTLAAEKRITGKWIILDYGRRYYRHHNETSRAGHCSRWDSAIYKRETASATCFLYTGKSSCQ